MSRNPALPSKILEYLFQQTDEYEADYAIQEIDICDLCCPSKYNNPFICNPYDIRTSLLYDPALHVEDCASSSKIERFAEHPQTTIKILQKLKNNKYSAVRKTVAYSHKLTETMIYELAEDVSCYVRKAIVENKLTPAKLLDRLKFDRCTLVRQTIAANPRTTLATLRELLYDRHEEVVQKAMLNLASVSGK